MRYGVFADVHGNLPALRAAIATLQRAGVDEMLCLGDLVGYGPSPNECVALVAELDAVCVAGNHDLIAVGRMGDERCGALARTTMRWTREVLGDDATSYLSALPLEARPDGAILMTHGAPGDPGRYLATRDQARQQLAALAAAAAGIRLLLVGHTHLSMACGLRDGLLLRRGTGQVPLDEADRVLLNPGAVGQSRQLSARVRVLVLDVDRRTATFMASRYDAAATRRGLKRAGLPARTHHQPPSVRRALRARAGRLAHAARRA
jgi:predicted phosphodiesterase